MGSLVEVIFCSAAEKDHTAVLRFTTWRSDRSGCSKYLATGGGVGLSAQRLRPRGIFRPISPWPVNKEVPAVLFLKEDSPCPSLHVSAKLIYRTDSSANIWYAAQMGKSERVFSEQALSPYARIMMAQFVNRWDMYPKQIKNGRYISIHQDFNVGLMFSHLQGNITLGSYLLDENSQGHAIVLDADDDQSWKDLKIIANDLALLRCPSYLEESRRGGHVWFFFEQQLPAINLRRFGRGILDVYDLDKVELYPKQDKLVDGPGSLIRMPFGIHRLTGKRYGFSFPSGEKLGDTIREQIKVLSKPLYPQKEPFDFFYQQGMENEIKTAKSTISQAEGPLFELGTDAQVSEKIKAAISVFDFISEFVDLSPRGKGLCPLHEDSNPSFSVNQDRNYWHCFTCDKGGSIIDFWMQYKNCDFKTALRGLADILL